MSGRKETTSRNSNAPEALADFLQSNRLAPQAQINFVGSEESGLVGAVSGAVVVDTCGFAREEEFAVKRAGALREEK